MMLRVGGLALVIVLQIAAATAQTPATPPPSDSGPPSANQPPPAVQSRVETFMLCKGFDESGCPPDIHQLFGCETTQDEMAATICDVKRTRAKYSIIKKGDHPGVQCPFTWFLVTCAWAE